MGFREHAAWLNAAFCDKTKKTWKLSQQDYLRTFSVEDLSWCKALQTIEESSRNVFPFAYEELLRNPDALIGDLCQFLGKASREI